MTGQLWQQEARKAGASEALVSVIEDMRVGQQAMIKTLEDMERRHTTSETAIADLTRAFPSADFDGHKRYHETMILKLEETRRLRVAIQEKTISGLVWAGIVGLALMVWHELQRPFN
jgi:hypothetical protein